MAGLLLIGCPPSAPPPLPRHPLNGLWGSSSSGPELLLFAQPDGGLAWSPRRFRVLDKNITLTHHCRDISFDDAGQLVIPPGTAAAGVAVPGPNGLSLQWTAPLELLSTNLGCGLEDPFPYQRGEISGNFADGSVVLQADWFDLDGFRSRIERTEFTAERKTRCE